MSTSSIPHTPPETGGKFALADARALAEEVAALLRPGCAEIVVAGSIRREKPQVKDIELVARLQPELDRRLAESLLDSTILQAVACGALAFDKQVKRAGPRYKRLVLRDFAKRIIFTDGAAVGEVIESGLLAIDLFIADEQNFGNTLAIRTGDADFTRLMVTQRDWNGLMPKGLRQDEGYLWNWEPRAKVGFFLEDRGEIVPCPTEQAFFDALGIPFVAPPERNQHTARQLAIEAEARRPSRGD